MKPHEDPHSELAEIREELHQLERRVDALEHHEILPVPLVASSAVSSEQAGDAPEGLAFNQLIPVAGRATLGLAGAFLFRALAESGIGPRLLVVAVAILYAAAWLVLALRLRLRKPLASAIYGLTSALILAPLLWESTARFEILSPFVAAQILLAYLILASASFWPRSSEAAWASHPTAVFDIAALTAVITAIALMVRTGDLIPFASALLGIACAVEALVSFGHHTRIRALPALAADFAVWLVFYIATRPGGVPPGYRPVPVASALAVGSLLFVFYAIGIAKRTVLHRKLTSVFEMIQVVVAFALAAGGAIAITQGAAAASVGALSSIAAAACYFTAFSHFASPPPRNQIVFSTWALVLGLLSCSLILPESLLTWMWSAAAVVATVAGSRAFLPILNIHGAIYLLAAGFVSGLPLTIIETFAGPGVPQLHANILIVAVSALCCYAACLTSRNTPVMASLIPAFFAALTLSALSLVLLKPRPAILPTARTLVICSFALMLALAGSRKARYELTWISYAAIGLGALKLFIEDFRQSTPAALALALLCYGALLILVPKLRTGP